MKTKYLIIALIFCQSFNLPVTTYPIFIEDYNIYLYPEKGCSFLYISKIDDSTSVNINLLSCKGSMNVEVYRKGLIIEKGKYINSLDLLKVYKKRVGLKQGSKKQITSIFVSEYYQSLRDGVWLFYEKNSIKTKKYKKGILQED